MNGYWEVDVESLLFRFSKSKWMENCMKMMYDSSMQVRGMNREEENQHFKLLINRNIESL